MTLYEILEHKHQGLPGLGVDAPAGNDGKKGRSIYIGHVKELFDSIFLTSADLGYIRIKNQKEHRTNEDSSFYYKDQENFYRALTNQIKHMTTFSIYNLHGMYLRDGYNITQHAIQGAYDFGKFGWSIDMNSLLKNLDSTTDIDKNTAAIKGWLRSKTPEELEILGQKVKASGYIYMSLNRTKIGDPSYPNPYSNEDFSRRVFDVSYGNWIDEELNDYKGVDYLKEREMNQQSTNYNTNYTDDVLIPTTLSDKIKEGDILYIQDDITDKIISYIIVSPDLVKCRYDYFLTAKTIPLISLISSFGVDNERVQSYKNIVVHDLEINDLLNEYKKSAIDNFVKKYDKNFALSIDTNKDDNENFVLLDGIDSSEENNIKISLDSNKFNISTDNETELSLNNLYIKNCWTNINVPEYNNSNIILVDGVHIDNIEEKDFSDNYLYISVSPTKFFYVPSDTTYFGVIILDSNGNVITKRSSTGISTIQVYCPTNNGIYHIMTFAGDVKTSKYYSEMSELKIEGQNKKTYSKNDIIDDVEDIYTNDNFKFSSDIITCQQCMTTIKIDSGEGVSLENLYLNDKKIDSIYDIDSWIHINNIDANSEGASIEITFYNNIPNENGYDQTTIADYMKAIAKNRKIGEAIPETSERILVLTAVGTKDGKPVRTSYKIRQPGFSNPLGDIDVEFNSLLKNNKIEESNKSLNGILCNQIQYFTELKIKGFTNDKWGTYLEDPKIYLYVDLDNNIDIGKDTIESNFDNVHFYSNKDKNMFDNNGIKIKFSWIPNSTTVYHDSSLSLIESLETELPHYVEVYGDATQTGAMRSEWIYTSDASFLNNPGSEMPRDLIYKLNEDSYIGGISLLDARREQNIKIRTIVEIGNPVPMEFNFKWKLKKIEIRGKLKDEYDSSEEKEEIVFYKDFIDEEGIDRSPVSENTRFIINPVYMTACPSDAENITNTKIGRLIMNTGSEDNCQIRIGIQDIDYDAKHEFFDLKGYDNDTTRLKESRSNYNHVSDIRYYWPKKRYLQDNIQNIYIHPKDVKSEIKNDIITKKNSDFVNLLDILEPRRNILQNMYNISLIDIDSELNSDFSTTFLTMSYNAYVMNPMYRNEKLTFYYNNKQYAASMYNQWNTVSPMWTEQSIESEIVDSSLLLAKQTWNYEYEISDIFSQTKVNGGVITKSGDGYLNFDTEESVNRFDSSQYSLLGIYGLQETIDKSNEYIITKPIDVSLAPPIDFKNSPAENCYYRTMLYDMRWIYPFFISIDNTIKVQPYYFSNSYEAWIDKNIMEGFFFGRSKDSPEMLIEYVKDSSMFQDEQDETKYATPGRSKELYMEKKIEKDVYCMKNEMMIFEQNSSKVKVNMLIPYNVAYDIYPRTMYNTDMKNTINVFMLQCPSIINKSNYVFNNHYYDMPLYMMSDSEKSYYNEKFIDKGKPVHVASVLPPWEFNN